MGDRIVLEDGRAWAASSSLVAALVEEAGSGVRAASPELSAWLSDRATEPNGLVGFDVRAFPPSTRRTVLDALREAVGRLSNARAESAERLRRLERMLVAVERGEPPELLNDYTQTVAFDGNVLHLPRPQ